MYSIQERLVLFLFLKAEIQTFFAAKTEYNWMVNKCTRNSSLRMYFKGHATSNGLTLNV